MLLFKFIKKWIKTVIIKTNLYSHLTPCRSNNPTWSLLLRKHHLKSFVILFSLSKLNSSFVLFCSVYLFFFFFFFFWWNSSLENPFFILSYFILSFFSADLSICLIDDMSVCNMKLFLPSLFIHQLCYVFKTSVFYFFVFIHLIKFIWINSDFWRF